MLDWELYEICKQALLESCESSEEYEKEIQELTQELGV